MRNENQRQMPVIGGSSLLVIFAVLCLTVFSLLGLSTVQADKRLSDISIQAIADYYEADCAAEEILARLKAGQMPEGVSKKDGIYTYSCPISPQQQLVVEVRDADWAVLRWQAVSTVRWKEDTAVEVWDGQ